MLTTYWVLAINIVIYISANKVYVMFMFTNSKVYSSEFPGMTACTGNIKFS